ncbi:MAG: EamA family transporter [Marivibrio sp.]|uniref:DMT family transporter n=1 Tax=Marivibrio sp. TaxID=2039719 RepID=UPI0032F004C4
MTGLVAAVVAVLGWSVYATLAHGVKGAPVYTVLLWEFVAAAIGTFLVALFLARRAGRPFKTTPRSVAIASVGQFGFNVFFLAALPFAPTTHVNLTAYLWPAMVVLALPLIERTPFRPAAGLGALLGFAGVAVLIWEPGALQRSGEPAGYLLALACGGSWAAYSLLRRFAPDETAPTLAVSFAVCAAGAGATALMRGDALLPSPDVLIAALAIGLIPIALANSAWDVAIRSGESGRAALLSYGVPVLSTALIVAWTELEADLALALGAALVTLGVSLPELVDRRRRGRGRGRMGRPAP